MEWETLIGWALVALNLIAGNYLIAGGIALLMLAC